MTTNTDGLAPGPITSYGPVTNDAAERLRDDPALLVDRIRAARRQNAKWILDAALAEASRATVERIKERYAMHGDKYFVEWLDAEAER